MAECLPLWRLKRTARLLGGLGPRLSRFYARQFRSRQFWIDTISSQSFTNPYVAATEILLAHTADPVAAAVGRCVGTLQCVLGGGRLYGYCREHLFKRLGLHKGAGLSKRLGTTAADAGFSLVYCILPLTANYIVGGISPAKALVLGAKVSAAICWTGPLVGIFMDTFNALDSDDPLRRAQVLGPVRRAIVDPVALSSRRKLMWALTASSALATAAIYTVAPGGIFNR